MKTLSDTPFSILDLSPIRRGGTAAESFRNTLDLARHADRWGYRRYWLAEHHGIPGVASAATAVVIGQVAATTSRIRVGSGGIMLPNHAPLVTAEQFGTLASFFPGRIDLGLGRAPGGDHRTARALRRSFGSADTFPQDLEELRGYFRKGGPGNGVHAVPGEGLDVPVWLLGSSDYSARLAAHFGLPFAFASHFAPDFLHQAIAIYRHEFEPSDVLERPHVMVGVNAVAAVAKYGILGVLGFGAPLAGIALLVWMKRLASHRVTVYENGFSYVYGNSEDVCPWLEVEKISEVFTAEQMKVLKVPGASIKNIDRSFIVRRKDGKDFGFSVNSIDSVPRFAACLKQASQRHSIPWEQINQ